MDDLVSKFINFFFPPSKTTNLRNEITNFRQIAQESFSEAWERFKELLRKCPHHGFSLMHQLDTFYNSLSYNDQDSLNSAVGGNFLYKSHEGYKYRGNLRAKVRCSRNAVMRVSTNAPPPSSNSSSNFEFQQMAAALEDKMTLTFRNEMNEMKNVMKALVPTPVPINAGWRRCTTCGSNHSFNVCPRLERVRVPVYHDNFHNVKQTLRLVILLTWKMRIPSSQISEPYSPLVFLQTKVNHPIKGISLIKEWYLTKRSTTKFSIVLANQLDNFQENTEGSMQITNGFPKQFAKAFCWWFLSKSKPTFYFYFYGTYTLPSNTITNPRKNDGTKDKVLPSTKTSTSGYPKILCPVKSVSSPNSPEPSSAQVDNSPPSKEPSKKNRLPYPSRVEHEKKAVKKSCVKPKKKVKRMAIHRRFCLGRLGIIEIRKITQEAKELRESEARDRSKKIFIDDDDDNLGFYAVHPNTIHIPVSQNVEPKDSLIMGDEHINITPETEAISVETLVSNPSESDDFSLGECNLFNIDDSYYEKSTSRLAHLAPISPEIVEVCVDNDDTDDDDDCDMPVCDESSPIFTIFSNPLFDSNENFSSDDESLFEEEIQKDEFNSFSNPLYDIDDEIITNESYSLSRKDLDEIILIPPGIDEPCFNAESDLLESLLNRDSPIDSTKTDSIFDEFSFPRLPEEHNSENVDTIIESLSYSPIPVEDSDSLIEEIDLFLTSDDSMPPGIESDDYDSEGDFRFLEELLINDSLPLPENESYNLNSVDNPESPVVKSCFDFEPVVAVTNDFDVLNDVESFDSGEGENVDSLNVEEEDSFTFTIRSFLPFVTIRVIPHSYSAGVKD
ncbi:reverse transcriptase domain-containing protein [Tanacetum coccineum]